MMKKSFLKSGLVGVALLASAGVANASTVTATYTLSGSFDDWFTTVGTGVYEFVVNNAGGLTTTFEYLGFTPDLATSSASFALSEDTDSAIGSVTAGTSLLNWSWVHNGANVDQVIHLAQGQYQLAVLANAAQVGVSTNVSAVPLPAAAWLFGSALFGFMGWSNRRKV